MFEKIEDYTELLMPLDLLSENSVLHDLREALTPEACQDVEVIGWLYQYYISERRMKSLRRSTESKDRSAGYPCGDAVVHAALDRAISGGEFARAAVDAQSSRIRDCVKKMEYYIAASSGGNGLFANRQP